MTVGASAAPKRDGGTKPAAGNATIYLMRPMPVFGWANAPYVRLDSRLVGEISSGSYFVMSVPRGPHTISIQGGLDAGREHDLQVEAGKSYFIEVGPYAIQTPGHQLITRALSGNMSGQQMAGRGILGAYTLYLLSAEEGRAKIATLKKIVR